MPVLNFQAEWHPDEERMHVSLWLDGQAHVEKFDREQWAEYIARLDTDELRVGGMVLELSNGPKFPTQKLDDMRQHIKDYFRRVDYAFRMRGSTEYISDQTGAHWSNIRARKRL